MATCGNCKQTDQTVEHVKSCYAERFSTTTADVEVKGFAKHYVESKDFRPMALAEVPDSNYAVVGDDGVPKFYEVKHGKKGGKWENFQFVSLLVGAPGDWNKYPVKGADRKGVLALLAEDPKKFALAYSREHVRCAACNSPLSDPESLERGFGPYCAERFS